MKLMQILEKVRKRSEMPQVKKGDMKDAFKILQKNNIDVTKEEVYPHQLKKAQKEIYEDKVKNIVKELMDGKKMPPLVVSSDNYIVDGHHRNEAYKLYAPKEIIEVIKINLPKDKAIEAYKIVEDLV